MKLLRELKLGTELMLSGNLAEDNIKKIEEHFLSYHKGMKQVFPDYKYRVNDHKILHTGVCCHSGLQVWGYTINRVDSSFCEDLGHTMSSA